MAPNLYLYFLLLLLAELYAIEARNRRKTYKGYQVLRLRGQPDGIRDAVEDIHHRFENEVEPWSYNPSWADIMISPRAIEAVKAHIRRKLSDFTFTTVIPDVHRKERMEGIRGRRQTHLRNRRSGGRRPAFKFNYAQYHSHSKMNRWMRHMEKIHPRIVKVFNVTNSWERRQVLGIKIGVPGPRKENVWIDGGIHAREWISSASLIYAASQLIKSYRRNRNVTELLRKFDVYILPMANPDGYQYSRTTDRLWRKTRSKHNSTIPCYGVDPNRNWGHCWGEIASDSIELLQPCENIYAGPNAFSEPETAGIRDYVTRNLRQLKLYLSLHSYGMVFLGAWGYTTILPTNHSKQKALAQLAMDRIKNVTINQPQYSFGTIANKMYMASGTSVDYFHSHGVPYAFAVELPPEDDNLEGFFVHTSEIIPIGDQIFHGLTAMLTGLASGQF